MVSLHVKRACIIGLVGLVLLAGATGSAAAQGRSPNANSKANANASQGSAPGSAPALAGAGLSSNRTDAAGALGDGGDAARIGVYGDLQGGFSRSIDENLYLRLDGAIDLEGQPDSGATDGARGTIGFGWRY